MNTKNYSEEKKKLDTEAAKKFVGEFANFLFENADASRFRKKFEWDGTTVVTEADVDSISACSEEEMSYAQTVSEKCDISSLCSERMLRRWNEIAFG